MRRRDLITTPRGEAGFEPLRMSLSWYERGTWCLLSGTLWRDVWWQFVDWKRAAHIRPEIDPQADPQDVLGFATSKISMCCRLMAQGSQHFHPSGDDEGPHRGSGRSWNIWFWNSRDILRGSQCEGFECWHHSSWQWRIVSRCFMMPQDPSSASTCKAACGRPKLPESLYGGWHWTSTAIVDDCNDQAISLTSQNDISESDSEHTRKYLLQSEQPHHPPDLQPEKSCFHTVGQREASA